MDMRRIQVVYTERLFPGETSELYRGPLDEAPSLSVIKDKILSAASKGETKGVVVKDGPFPADRGACRWSWWIAEAGRE